MYPKDKDLWSDYVTGESEDLEKLYTNYSLVRWSPFELEKCLGMDERIQSMINVCC
jgi:hypothetical protein